MKLLALINRKIQAMRDVYDIHYFLKQNWEIDETIISSYTGKHVREYLGTCIAAVENIKEHEVPQGLGELLEEKEKNWVRQNLKSETLFLLKNYRSSLE